MDMQLDVTDQVLDVASERTKCSKLGFIRDHLPGQTNFQKQLSNKIVHRDCRLGCTGG
ncbi:hypothetical protein T4B_13315 [Trichinella pseudospiralis]|uniref:Uncharacterized protein n=1 Tax=Trichinella pseudospiralis TaxID=6337 RepID=A0A0V1JEN5_TRIPS|nr:hypothetical protein T4B_13315 [Trichinella pseudospiralis]